MAQQQKFPNPKNLVKVSRLKQVVKELEDENYTLNRMMDNDRPEDADTETLKKISNNQAKINKYNTILKVNKRYKVNM